MMAGYWRLTRTSTARRLYEAFKRAGLTATRMHEYEVSLAEVDTGNSPLLPAKIQLETYPPDVVQTLSDDIDFSRSVDPLEGEWAIVAYAENRPVGRTLVSDEAAPYVEPLERSLPLSGAYVRRVFVNPDHRGAGIASNLLLDALVVARDELNCDTATALIAVDNEPSQRLFEGRGFRRLRTHDYVRAARLSKYRVQE